MRNTSHTGYLSELTAQRRVAALGVGVLLPMGMPEPFDFVGHLNGVFTRIQVKTARPDKDGLRFHTSTGMGESRRGLTPLDCDVILAVCPDGECYIITPNGASQRVLTRAQMEASVLKDVTQLFVVKGVLPTKKVKGVLWHPRTSCWTAQVMVNGKRKQAGYFKSYEEAVAAAEKAREDLTQLEGDAAFRH